jgi:ubiquinone/menaquinone biosynthesis C-methylase UbiE
MTMVSDTQFWDDAAEKYSQKPVANVAAYQKKLAITKERLRPTDVVLDVGCGTGSLALELSPHVAEVHALDISPEMLRIGTRKAADAGVTNITFHQGTLEDAISFHAEQFDGVCAYNILHLVGDRVATLRRIYELLKPGGFFIQSTAVLSDSWVPFGVVLAVMRWLGKAPSVNIFGKDTLLADMREVGFVNASTPDVGAKKETAFVVAAKP